jgi:hypothetical protein
MTQSLPERSGSVVEGCSPTDHRPILRRAEHLCRRAEPHADVIPCQTHLHEAQRQLLGPV